MLGLKFKSLLFVEEILLFSSSVCFKTDTRSLDDAVLTTSDLRRKLSIFDFLVAVIDDFEVDEDEFGLFDDKICLKMDAILFFKARDK